MRFNILCVWLENAYLRTLLGFFVPMGPQRERYQQKPQKAHPCMERCRMTYRSSKMVHLIQKLVAMATSLERSEKEAKRVRSVIYDQISTTF